MITHQDGAALFASRAAGALSLAAAVVGTATWGRRSRLEAKPGMELEVTSSTDMQVIKLAL